MSGSALLILLLTVAVAAVGWWAWQQSEQEQSRPEREPDDARVVPLLRGINYLLSDQTDRALQEMVQVARLRSDAIDVYMALGEMFRGNGEIGRAVRIHQNLLARPDITPGQELEAHYALGRDFHTGGLLDRALRQYDKALAIAPDHLPSLEASLRIREQGKEWLKAEELLCRIERIRGEDARFHRAFLYAEEARRCLHDEGDEAQARHFADRAIDLDQGCASARLVMLELLLRRDADWPEMEGVLRGLWQHCPHHAMEAVPLLLRQERHREEIESFLLAVWRARRDEGMMLTWLEQLHEAGRDDDLRRLIGAVGFVPDSLRGDLRLLALGCGAAGSDVPDGRLVARARRWRQQVKDFCCSECGVEVREMRWQCPQCHQWGTMRPIQVVRL
ncbi:MAG: heat-shock protein [Zetaproteobacteria bacterium]|nr:MAG: heat-shock protein [Zetaproteobacteria bacterium]